MAVTPEPIASDRAGPPSAIGILTTDDFVGELRDQLGSASDRIVLQLMTFDGDRAGLEVGDLLLAAVGRGVDVQLIVDSFALRFVSDRPVTDPAVQDEYAATLSMYEKLAVGGVDLRFTNANGPGRIFALARNHKKVYVIDDVAYLGGINVSDHNFEWHDFMLRIEDPEVCSILLADLAGTASGRYATIDRTLERSIGGADPSEITLVTNGALRVSFDRLIAQARQRIVVASPYALDRRLLDVLGRSTAPDRTVVIADHNNFKILQAITPFLTARARQAGINLATYERFSHSKFLLVDDDRLLVGSSNFGRHSLTCNQEIGLVIRDRAFIAEFESTVLSGLVPAEPTTAPGLLAFGWLATLGMEAYLAFYAKVIAPRVPLLAASPGLE